MLSNHLNWYHANMSAQNKAIRKSFLSSSGCRYSMDARESRMLRRDIKKVQSILRPYARLSGMAWKVRFMRDSCGIENNYPHTHADVIFFPSMYFEMVESERIRLLIHERIHVYQRFHPIPYHKLLFMHFGYAVHSYRPSHSQVDRVRTNPDVNDLIYSRGDKYALPILLEGANSIANVKMGTYSTKSDLPAGVDNKYGVSDEHANETVAYYLENRIKENTVPVEMRQYL